MADILGLGMTHTPPLIGHDDPIRVKSMRHDPLLPERYKDPNAWPAPMREQWGEDEGRSHALRHRAELIECMRWARRELDAFNPDLLLIWGDDQYENFREDGVPSFSINAYDSFDVRPWAHGRADGRNAWNEPAETEFHFRGHRVAGKHLAGRLIEQGFDVAYAYRPRHDVLPHAFLNTVLFLDWDRRGFGYPIVPFATNCYGRGLIPLRGGGVNDLANIPDEADLDPPSPQPWRCFELGAAIARIMAASPWRVALVASSSWSHAFLSPRTSYFHPDVEADRRYFEALRAGEYERWREATLADVEASGHQELLNWFCLLGAMAELGRRPQEARFLESWLTNADKVFAVFRP
jgi:Catalytic LigB subunit of aromatic ring-opening dioxygenase